jgi:diacylglycerol kinase (ATP)
MIAHRCMTLIYNPWAGFGDWSRLVSLVVDFWQNNGWQVHVEATNHPGHATELAQVAARAGHPLVLAAGGDGTLNEVANGLAGSETILAPLPFGTANSLAKELGEPRPNLINPQWLPRALDLLIGGRVQRVDLGQCDNGRHWLLWAGAGADSYVVQQMEPRSRLFKRLGPAAYAAKGLLHLPGFSGTHARVTVDAQMEGEQTIEDEFLLICICNCQWWAGGELHLNSGAVLDDGFFELWLFRGHDWPQLLPYALAISQQRHLELPGVTRFVARSVQVESQTPIPFHLDGEPCGETPFTCTIQPSTLRLLVPASAPTDLFVNAGEML